MLSQDSIKGQNKTEEHIWYTQKKSDKYDKDVFPLYNYSSINAGPFEMSVENKLKRGNFRVNLKRTAGCWSSVVLLVSETRCTHELFSPILKVKVKWSTQQQLGEYCACVCVLVCVRQTDRERGRYCSYIKEAAEKLIEPSGKSRRFQHGT